MREHLLLIIGLPLISETVTVCSLILQNYAELMDLAERGDNLKLDMTDEDLVGNPEESKASSRGDMYSDWDSSQASSRPLFTWGKAVGKRLGKCQPC